MKSSPENTDDALAPPDRATAFLLLRDAGSTMVRMCVPSLGMTLIGVWLDGILETTPWCMFGGIILGLGTAVFLVKMQIGRIKQRKDIR